MRLVPNNLTIIRLIIGFQECGSVTDTKRTGSLAILSEGKLVEVKTLMQRLPSKNLEETNQYHLRFQMEVLRK